MITAESLDQFIKEFEDIPELHDKLKSMYYIDSEANQLYGFDKGIVLNLQPNGEIEELIMQYSNKLKLHHLKVILDRNYDELFQDGIAHIDWNTERRSLVNEYIKANSDKLQKVGGYTVNAAWTEDTYTYYRGLEEGLYLMTLIKENRVEIGSRFKADIVDESDVVFFDDYMLVQIATDGISKAWIIQDGGYYNSHMFTGTYQQCIDRATELKLTPNQFMIVNLKLVRESNRK